ncbi:hypothetical protein BKA80DRAFT_42714 [Phyllosticta citrichinensis]
MPARAVSKFLTTATHTHKPHIRSIPDGHDQSHLARLVGGPAHILRVHHPKHGRPRPLHPRSGSLLAGLLSVLSTRRVASTFRTLTDDRVRGGEGPGWLVTQGRPACRSAPPPRRREGGAIWHETSRSATSISSVTRCSCPFGMRVYLSRPG